MTRRARRTDEVPRPAARPPARRARLDITPIDLPRKLAPAAGTHDDGEPDSNMTEEYLDPGTPEPEVEPTPEPAPEPPPESDPG